jgi:hypothetical protein
MRACSLDSYKVLTFLSHSKKVGPIVTQVNGTITCVNANNRCTKINLPTELIYVGLEIFNIISKHENVDT